MRLGKRERLWIGLLLLTGLAWLWPLPETDIPQGTTAERKSSPRSRNAPASAPSARTLGALNASTPAPKAAVLDLFPRQSWSLPQQPSATAEHPSAPALPFSYGGRYTEGEKIFIFLNEGTQVHTARQGDTVKGSYRIDRIGDEEITLTYLPLGQQQSLPTGSMMPRK